MRSLASPLFRQLFRYFFVSGLNFVLTFCVFTLSLKVFDISYPISLTLAFLTGNVFTYVLNYIFVFRVGTKFSVAPFAKYIFANAFSFGVNLTALVFIVESFSVDPFWTQVVLIAPIVAINFLSAKFWSLKEDAYLKRT